MLQSLRLQNRSASTFQSAPPVTPMPAMPAIVWTRPKMHAPSHQQALRLTGEKQLRPEKPVPRQLQQIQEPVRAKMISR